MMNPSCVVGELARAELHASSGQASTQPARESGHREARRGEYSNRAYCDVSVKLRSLLLLMLICAR